MDTNPFFSKRGVSRLFSFAESNALQAIHARILMEAIEVRKILNKH